jgi:hypothetical protein
VSDERAIIFKGSLTNCLRDGKSTRCRRKSIPGPYEGLMLEEENKVRKN